MGPREVEAFLNHLAVVKKVAASTQSQALNAIIFLYSGVLESPLAHMAGLKRVQKRQLVPVVLNREEVKEVLSRMEGTCRLMAELIYGAGLRVHECVTLRVKDIDLHARTVTVRNSKGSKDRLILFLLARQAERGRGVADMDDFLARQATRVLDLIASIERAHGFTETERRDDVA